MTAKPHTIINVCLNFAQENFHGFIYCSLINIWQKQISRLPLHRAGMRQYNIKICALYRIKNFMLLLSAKLLIIKPMSKGLNKITILRSNRLSIKTYARKSIIFINRIRSTNYKSAPLIQIINTTIFKIFNIGKLFFNPNFPAHIFITYLNYISDILRTLFMIAAYKIPSISTILKYSFQVLVIFIKQIIKCGISKNNNASLIRWIIGLYTPIIIKKRAKTRKIRMGIANP